MKKSFIHQSPEERLANETFLENQKTNKLLTDLKTKEAPTKMEMKLVNEPDELATAFFSMLKGKKGDKGDKGDRGDNGKDGERGEKGDSIVGPKGDRGIAGPQGVQGIQGIGLAGKDGTDGKDGSPDTPDEIVDKVNTSKKVIDAERVRGLAQVIRNVE